MLAFLFPGQGSQHPGMGLPWADHSSWSVVDEASEVLGRDLAHLLLDADADELVATANAQIATYVTSLVVLDALRRAGVAPAACAGHSLGEYSALTAAGALSFTDGLRLVQARGEAMASAAGARPGTMAAVIGLDDDTVEEACRRAGGDVWVANHNAPGQVVVSGAEEAVAALHKTAKALGARRVLSLAVGGAFHTPYMAPASGALAVALERATFRPPRVPVVANVDADVHRPGGEWAAVLLQQLCRPVRWRQSVERLVDDGATTLVEVGAGKVLSGMARRIVPDAGTVSVSVPDDVERLAEVATQSPPRPSASPDGEHLHMAERLVVSPAAGVFCPAERWRENLAGSRVEVGEVLGTVGSEEIRSRFSGVVMGIIAHDGEQLVASQPIAWLRTA
ncbi:MAG TPA: ACP S-malonyltransferase [Acidimicrobiales bacterium]|nr:ACP S-malonyltransferase [Acidimicrobiales bacterium]